VRAPRAAVREAALPVGEPIFVLAIVWLSFTVPSTSVLPESCDVVVGPEHMRAIVAYGRLPGQLAGAQLRSWIVAGLQGQHITRELELAQPTYLSLVAVDSAGNRSCASAEVLANVPTTAVPPGDAGADERERCFDVAGARARPPLRPGIYWCVRGDRRRRLVLVR
jgi:hypothetical protein